VSESDFSRVAEAIAFLCGRAREQPRLAEVAGHVGLSEWHFHRVFQAWAGISPKRFLQVLALGTARRLLLEGTSVADASSALGLSSPSRLHDLFIHLEGMTPGQFKQRGRDLTVLWSIQETLLGPALFAQLEGALVGLAFLAGDEPAQTLARTRKRWPEARFVEAPGALEPHGEALSERLRGGPRKPLHILLRGTPFQLRVWEALLLIPEGRALTYQDLARVAGRGATAQAVGATLRRNPVACFIPCHRVIQESGALGY
jgi:AraC family transcriptional regulator of adaptative response/methylated-DNA-[protein]-cysteine methyltransferase